MFNLYWIISYFLHLLKQKKLYFCLKFILPWLQVGLPSVLCFGTRFPLIDIEGLKISQGSSKLRCNERTDVKIVKHKWNVNTCHSAFTNINYTALKLFNGKLDTFYKFICLVIWPWTFCSTERRIFLAKITLLIFEECFFPYHSIFPNCVLKKQFISTDI